MSTDAFAGGVATSRSRVLRDRRRFPLRPRPKTDKTLAKALPASAIDALLGVLDADAGHDGRRDAWAIRDRAVIRTALLTGLRLWELVGLNIADIRTVAGGAVLHVRGKGGKDRRTRSRRRCWPSLTSIWPAGRCASAPRVATPPPGAWPAGRRRRRCSSPPATAPGSPSALCSTGCCGPVRRAGIDACPGDLPAEVGASEDCVLRRFGEKFHLTVNHHLGHFAHRANWRYTLSDFGVVSPQC